MAALPGALRGWRSFWLSGEELFAGDHAVRIFVENEQGPGGGFDFIGGNGSVAVEIQRHQNAWPRDFPGGGWWKLFAGLRFGGLGRDFFTAQGSVAIFVERDQGIRGVRNFIGGQFAVAVGVDDALQAVRRWLGWLGICCMDARDAGQGNKDEVGFGNFHFF